MEENCWFKKQKKLDHSGSINFMQVAKNLKYLGL
jgi:hypothetical protein